MKPNALESRPQAYKRITDGIRNFLNHSVGAMKLIQEAKRMEIWKEKWSSWQEYCEKEFGKSRQRAYQLLEVAGTIDEIESVKRFDIESGKNKEILKNLNTRQTAALKGLPPEKKAEVLAKSIEAEGGKSPKAETINGVRRNLAKEPEIQLDKVGRPIPENIVADWNEAHNQATELRSTISKVKCILEQARKDKNPLFVEIPQGAISDAESLHFSIGHMLPYAVCPTCQGKLPEKCAMCHHRGFISKSYWEGPTVGNDLRNLIRKQYATSSLSA
jgi:hypothetical protein